MKQFIIILAFALGLFTGLSYFAKSAQSTRDAAIECTTDCEAK